MSEYEGLLKQGLALAELSQEEMEMFLQCALMERDVAAQEKIAVEVFKSAEAPFVVKVMRGRLQLFQKQLSPSLVLFLAGACANVAQAVLWAHALVSLVRRNPEKVVGFDIWTASFAEGLPTQEAYSEAWDEQKGKYSDNVVVPGAPTDNYLDTAEAWR